MTRSLEIKFAGSSYPQKIVLCEFEKKNPCDWVDDCPLVYNLDLGCRGCPAEREKREMTFQDALSWWKKHKFDYNINKGENNE